MKLNQFVQRKICFVVLAIVALYSAGYCVQSTQVGTTNVWEATTWKVVSFYQNACTESNIVYILCGDVGNGDWMYFDGSTSDGKNMLAVLLAAKTNDVAVHIWYSKNAVYKGWKFSATNGFAGNTYHLESALY